MIKVLTDEKEIAASEQCEKYKISDIKEYWRNLSLFEKRIFRILYDKPGSVVTKKLEDNYTMYYFLNTKAKLAIMIERGEITDMNNDGFLGYVCTEDEEDKKIETEFIEIEDDGFITPLEAITSNSAVQPRVPISWDEFFMGVAELAAKRSKDPSTQVGCCIADDDHKVLSLGYNGMPKVMENYNNDTIYPWERSGHPEDVKYSYIVHAELNAILNAGGRPLKDATLYVTLICCNECAKAIVQSGIKRVVYKEERDDEIFKIGKIILQNAGIEVIKFDPWKI